ncbi:MAG: CAP domain-containing protein [Paracoccaceae bacterium]
MKRHILMAVAGVGLLAGCGSDRQAVAVPVAVPVVASVSTPATSPDPSPILIAAPVVGTQAESGALLNQFRAENGLGALTRSAQLQRAAELHAADMDAGNEMTHTGTNGSTLGERVRAQGYGYCTVAENVAFGQRSLDEVMTAWITSAGHRKNMLLPAVTEYGLARTDRNYWVMVLGTSGC